MLRFFVVCLALTALPVVVKTTRAQSDSGSFAYDIKLPLDLRVTTVEKLSGVTVHDISYASPKGGRVSEATVAQKGDPPETVVITYQAKDGKEDELETLIKRQWATITKLGLVTEDSHYLFRGKDDSGKTFFVEILTWKNHNAPDNAPKQVTDIWNAMQLLVEKRLGHDGIEYPEVQRVKVNN